MNILKRLTLLLFIITFFLCIIPAAQAANSPSLNGIQIFPKDNIWNTRVDNLPVDAKSDVYIDDLITDAAPYSNLRHYISTAIPYNVVNSTQSRQYITRFGSLAYSDNVSYPIPDDPLFEQGCSDHHMEIIDTDEMVLYELYAVEKMADGSWHAGSGAVWDLNKNLFRKNNETPMWATDEAGLPIFPGLVRYDEVKSGYINHSLRISVPALQNTWIWPARTSSPLPGIDDPLHPPAGQRFRLKDSFDISGFPPQARVILQALKTYGAMATTNNGANRPVSLVGSPDTRWDYTDLNTLWQVQISDFEAVDVSSLMMDKNSAQARQISGIPPSSITVTSPNGGETWQLDTSQTVTWRYSGSPGPYVNIVLLKAGTEVGTIAGSIAIGSAGTGSYSGPIDPSMTTGSDYTVRVESAGPPDISDTSDNIFTLTQEPPTITVNVPEGGETWQRGTSHTITWDYTGSPGSTVKIVLVKGGVEAGTICAGTSTGTGGKGTYTWEIYPSGSTGSDYQVRVQSISRPAVTNTSRNNFTLTSAQVGLVAAFTGTPQSGTAPLDVTFTDLTTGPSVTNRRWDFGDGNISDYAVAANPFHQYTAAGTYTVNLTVSGPDGSNSSTHTGYITVSDAPPIAGFSGAPVSGTVPLTVSFTDASKGVISGYEWDFGDATHSFDQNPSHQYTAAGTYTVNLTVTGPGGSNSSTKTRYITVSDAPPIAGFSGAPVSGTVPLTVSFTDASKGVISGYEWDFGDATHSFDQNPSHQYTAAGTYTVNLTVTGPGGSNSSTKTRYITVSDAPPVAGFSGAPVSGTVPLTVSFTDASKGVISGYEWDFGDATHSFDQNPSHQYTAAGTYTVNLTASGPGGSNSSTKTGYITVSDAPPIAGFSGAPVSGTVPLTVSFTDASKGVISGYEWDFGDATHSFDQNPSHQYTAAGTYTVNLSVTGPGGSNCSTKTRYITVSDAPPIAGFSGAPVSGTVPLTVSFTDASKGVISGYEWDFGDATHSFDQNPSHQYTAAGTYTVNLTVTGPGGSNCSTKTRYITVSEPLTAITVTSPNGKETWQRGTSHTVTWDYSGNPGSTVKVTLVKGTTEVGTIVASTSIGTDGKGSCSWPVYSSGSTGSDYKVSVQSINQPTVKDSSNNYFTLTPAGTSSPSIAVTSPNGGETWQRGTTRTVTWDYSGSPGSTVKIMLVKGTTEVGTIIASTSIGTSGKGSYSWPVYSSGSTGSDYKVSVQSINQPTVKDSSNNYFSLAPAGTTAPSPTPTPISTSTITVTSPNGGETWARGTLRTITWDYTGSPGSAVRIVLMKGSAEAGTIIASTSMGTGGKGSCSWAMSSTGSTGTDYRVSVQSISQPSVRDTSNNYFSLTPAGTSSPSITVTSPNGGERWKRGTTHMVTWDYTGSPGSAVKIVLMKGSAEAGTIIASTSMGAGGKGAYSWPVYPSGSTGSDYKVSVRSISQPSVKDVSNNYFVLTV